MAGNLTINLTDDQQKQIRDATGKSVTHLIVKLADGQLADQALDQVAGGANWSGPGDEGPEESITFVYGKLA